MRDSAGADDGDLLWLGVASLAQRLAEGVGTTQRGERRALAIDVHRDDREVVLRRQEIQRNDDAVIEFPFLGIGDVDVLE